MTSVMHPTSPEHNAIVARAVTNRRAHAAATTTSEQIRLDWTLTEIRMSLYAVDHCRYTVERAAPESTLYYLTDRWRSECGDIHDWGQDVDQLRASAQRMNDTNAQTGRAHLAERLAEHDAVVWSAASGPLVPVSGADIVRAERRVS